MGKEKKETFPTIPTKHWWVLRRQFIRSMPIKVDANYFSSTLNMKPDSAKANVIPSLVQMGIIDEDLKTTELARKWRDDKEYSNVCKKIRDKVYPKELLETAPPPDPDGEAVKRWFALRTGAGQNAINKYTTIYLVLSNADSTKGTVKQQAAPAPKKQKTTKQTEKGSSTGIGTSQKGTKLPFKPNLHIDLQIHISPEATAEQIDKIFESIANHLYTE